MPNRIRLCAGDQVLDAKQEFSLEATCADLRLPCSQAARLYRLPFPNPKHPDSILAKIRRRENIYNIIGLLEPEDTNMLNICLL